MDEHQLFQNARRWPGKAAGNTSTADYLAEHLEDICSLLHTAQDHYEAGAYGEGYATLEKAKSKADAIQGSSGWTEDGYDYEARMYNESYPAIEQLLTMMEEAEELENV